MGQYFASCPAGFSSAEGSEIRRRLRHHLPAAISERRYGVSQHVAVVCIRSHNHRSLELCVVRSKDDSGCRKVWKLHSRGRIPLFLARGVGLFAVPFTFETRLFQATAVSLKARLLLSTTK